MRCKKRGSEKKKVHSTSKTQPTTRGDDESLPVSVKKSGERSRVHVTKGTRGGKDEQGKGEKILTQRTRNGCTKKKSERLTGEGQQKENQKGSSNSGRKLKSKPKCEKKFSEGAYEVRIGKRPCKKGSGIGKT